MNSDILAFRINYAGNSKMKKKSKNLSVFPIVITLIFIGIYFVMELDKDYQWALICSSSDKYLWILSRKPQMEKDLYKTLIDKLQKRGYDVTQLIKVEQKKPEILIEIKNEY